MTRFCLLVAGSASPSFREAVVICGYRRVQGHSRYASRTTIDLSNVPTVTAVAALILFGTSHLDGELRCIRGSNESEECCGYICVEGYRVMLPGSRYVDAWSLVWRHPCFRSRALQDEGTPRSGHHEHQCAESGVFGLCLTENSNQGVTSGKFP